MSNGSLHVKILLDKPQHVYCGSGEPVTGRVSLRYVPAQDERGGPQVTELFGPLRITIFFKGRIKTKIDKDYRGRVELFSIAVPAHDGPIQIPATRIPFPPTPEPHIFPFAVRFPDAVAGSSYPEFEAHDDRFDVSPAQPLPPTCDVDHADGFVEYWVDVRVAVPGLHVTVFAPAEGTGPRVRYERPGPLTPPAPKPRQVRGTLFAQNAHLLSEEERPRGFRQKVRASLAGPANLPIATFAWSLTAPTQVSRGDSIELTVGARPDPDRSTAAVIPDVRLVRCAVRIEACSAIRSEINVVHGHDSVGIKEHVCAVPSLVDSAPFSADAGWSVSIVARPPKDLPSSFKSVCIAQYCRMKVYLKFLLAGETFEYDRPIPLTVYPPVVSLVQVPDALPPIEDGGEPVLPSYGEATDPQPPPEYHAVTST